MRIQHFPTIKDPPPTFKTSWKKILTHCSVELTKILTTQYTLDMTSLHEEIERLNLPFKHLLDILDIPSFSTKWKGVKERLEGMNKDIITKKQAKFVKYKLAFSEGFSYKWSGRSVSRRGPQQETYPRNPTKDQS